MRRENSKNLLLSQEGVVSLLEVLTASLISGTPLGGVLLVSICIHSALRSENTVLITLNVIQIWCRCHWVNTTDKKRRPKTACKLIQHSSLFLRVFIYLITPEM